MKSRLSVLLPLATGLLLLGFPLIRELHYESALIAAVIGSFWAVARFSVFRQQADLDELLVIFRGMLLLATPVFIYSLVTRCFSFDGLLFWLLYPFPSVLFSASIARVVRLFVPDKALIISLFLILLIGVGVVIAELKLLPQVYFFNHVWGGLPGPIYDEEVRVTSSLWLFRGITFGWTLLLWNIPAIRRNRLSVIFSGSALLFLSVSYSQLPQWGIISPRSFLQEQLELHVATAHFDLYMDADRFTEEEAAYWAKKHEFYFHQVNEILDIDWPEGRKIESYLYAHAWQKKDLVGAKFTSYVPVWQEQDQLHIAKEHLDGVLKHELVHVIAKQFGNRLFNASYSIGLIEGLAEGIAGDASAVSTLDQILAANPPYPDADQMKKSLSWRGFYSDAAAISYTTAGSFVRYLLEHYPVEYLKDAYRLSDPAEAYPVPFDTLVAEWIRSLPSVEIDETDKAVSRNVFAQRSVFQKSCPHSPSRLERMWDSWRYARASEQDSLQYDRIRDLYDAFPEIPRIQQEWAIAALMNGNYRAVIERLDTVAGPFLKLLKADALLLNEDIDRAFALRDSVEAEFENDLSESIQLNLDLRSDPVNWNAYLAIRYGNSKSVTNTDELNALTRFWLIRAEASQNDIERLADLAGNFVPSPSTEIPFDWYEPITDRLIFSGSCTIASNWLDAGMKMSLRLREKERFNELSYAHDYVCQQ